MRKINFLITCFAFVLFFSIGFSQASAQIAATDARLIEPTRSETVASIMQRQSLAPAQNIRLSVEKDIPARKHLKQNPLAQPVASFPASANNLTTPASTNLTSGLSFNGVTGPTETGAFPPDDMGAIGPTQYIVAVNGRIRSFNKTTGVADGVLNADPDVFFSSVMTPVGGGVVSVFTSDPRIRYDRISARWIMLIIDVPCTNGSCTTTAANRVLIAVSNTSTITGATVWTFTQFIGQASRFFDYPTLGMDNNAIYIGGNMFSLAGSFQATNGYVINRANVMANAAYTVYTFADLALGVGAGPYTPQGVDNFDAATTEGYFVGVDNATFSTLMIRRVSTPAAVPTISSNISLTVPTTAYPQTVPHLGNTGGTNGNLDALDDRLYAAMIRNGRLWTAHNISVNNAGVGTTTGAIRRNGVRWYEIQNLTATPALVQSGTIFDPNATAASARWYSIPSIMVSGQGHAIVTMTTAGVERANAAAATRFSNDALGTMQTAILTTASATAYNPPADPGPGRRWGDYSYVSLDPLDDMTMWAISQYCVGTNLYGCDVSKLLAPLPATPSVCVPATTAAGQASVNVVLTGLSVSGSGFYDPGANMAAPALPFNHISASVTGGVTVNSVTYTNPTTITLNLNTTGAPAGTKSITVTNPDGQTMTSATPILTITSAGQTSDLAITKTDGVTTYTAGGTTTYTIVASNAGPNTSTGATVTDNFPAAITSVAWTAAYAGGATGPANGVGNIAATVNLPVAGTATFTAVCNISPGASGNLVNTATVAVPVGDTDPNAGNNSATDTDTQTGSGPVTVTASAGVPGPTPYNTVKLAFDAINAGTHQGAIVVNVNSSTDEGATPAVLNSSGTGSASYTSVLMRPTADGLSVVGSGTPASRGVIELNGADNVTIDGDNPNTGGTNRNLTISLTTTNLAVLIWVKTPTAADGCLGNTFKNCNLNGQGTYTSIAAVLAGSATTFGNPALSPNSNNTIQNNSIVRVQNGLYQNGFATTPFDVNWQVLDNAMGSSVLADKLGFRGMILINSSGYLVNNNTITGINSSTATSSTMSGIQLATGNLNGTISNNKISDIKHNNTAGWGSNGIWLNGATVASNTNVYNNMISDVASFGFNDVTPADNGYGMVISGGGGYNVYYNTIVMNTNQSFATGLPAALNVTTGITTANTLNIRDNLIVNTQTVGTQRYCVLSSAAATVYQDINYNDYYFTGPNLGTIGGTARANLAAWQTGTGKDAQSITAQPYFVSATDLHLIANSNCAINAKGTPITVPPVTTDIDGNTRNATTPDIGADEINGNDPAATISYAGSPYCSNAGTATVTQTGTTGGTYTAAPAGLTINASTGAVTLGTSTPGTYTVTYTIVAAGSCPLFTTTASITVTAAPAATISYGGSPYCSSAGTATVTQTGTTGGTYSAAPAGLTINASTGAVTLGTSTAGTYTVTYSIAAAGGCALFTTTASITVTAAPAATISYAGSPYCSNAGTATVTQTGTTGGTYSAAPAGLTINASTGAVTLGTSTAGTYTVTYTIAAAGGCALFTTTASITVTAAPAATISYAGNPYCANAGTANVTRTGTAGGTYSAAPAGLTINAGTGAVTLGTSTPGTYTVTYSIAAAGGCALFTTTASITVTAVPAATISYAGTPYCSNAGTATVTQTGTAGGTYSAAPAGLTINASTGAVTLGTSPSGTYTVTYTIAASGGCALFTTTTSITITAAPGATISYTGSPYCTTGGTATVTQFGTAGGTYSAAGGLTLNASTGAVTLGTSTPGTYTVTYTIAAGGGCPLYTTTASITVNICVFPCLENFDGVTVPALPAGWTATTGTAGGGSTPWVTTATASSSAPNSAFTNNATNISDEYLDSRPYTIAATGPNRLIFRNNYDLEASVTPTVGYDGMVLEISINGGAFTDIITAGGTFVTGGYNRTISGIFSSPIANRPAWSGNSAGFITSSVDLPAAANGQSAVFRFRRATDNSVGVTGVWVDDVYVTPTATINYTGSPYCSNAGTATVTRTGAAGGTYSSTAGLSLNASTGDVTLGTSTPGTYTVTYTLAPSGCPLFTTTATITITAAPAATISYAGSPYCSNAGTATVTRTGTAGGTYSSTAGLTINASTGDVTLGTSTPGTYTVTYTIAAAGGCAVFTTTASITITALPAATISYAGSPYCSNAGTATVTRTGTAGGTYSSTAGLTINASTGDVTLGTSTPGTYTVTYTIAAGGGCPVVTATTTISITQLPAATISYAGTPYCSNAGTATVTRTGTAGGTYSAAPAGLTINASTGDVTLGTSTPGTYTVTYTIAAGGGCPVVTATTTITITALPAATISYAGSPYCQNAGTAAVTRTGTAGGTYSSTAGLTLNATTGDVTLGTSTPGTYTVTYTIAAGGGCPVVTATTTITITLPPSATIIYAGSPYCSNAGTANVTRTGTAGGTYSSTAGLTINATTGAVTLATSTAGTYTVTYTIAASGGCPVFTTSTTITITAAPAATIVYAGSPYCSTDLTAPVTRTGTGGGTYSSTAGLTINATTGTVTPNTSTPGTYTVTYTIAAGGGCGAFTTTTTITITQAPNAIIFYLNNPYCSNSGTATVSRFGTAGGTYSAAPAGLTINATTGAVTLGTSTPGTYTVTYTIAASGGCGITITTTTITITPAPSATISYTGSPYCSNAGTATVTRTGTAGGTYSSTAGLTLNATTGAVTLGTSTPGTYTVTYTVAASGGCAVFTTTTSITITALPAATISYAGSPYCSNAGTATVTRTGTAGGTYSSTAGLVINATTGDVNLATSTAGTYTVTYTIAAGGGCPVVTTTTTITITTLPAATITYTGNPFCQNAGTATVTRTGTAGGTYSAAPAGLTINATTGTVTLGTSTPGTYTVTYTIAAGGGCAVVTATTSITVSSLSVAATAATASSTSLCGPTAITLSVTGGSLGTGATWRWYSGSCGGTLVGTGATLNITPTATTTYFVRAEGTCNTTTCASVTVTVNIQPTIALTATLPTSLMPGQTSTLTATVTPANATNTTVWYRDGNVVPGATGLSLVVGVDALGLYTVRTTTTSGCTALSNAVLIKDSASGKMWLYPNPNSGQFQVRYYSNAQQLGFVRHIIMYNQAGQKVFDQTYPITGPYSNMNVDARILPSGVYVLQLTDAFRNEILATDRVVITR